MLLFSTSLIPLHCVALDELKSVWQSLKTEFRVQCVHISICVCVQEAIFRSSLYQYLGFLMCVLSLHCIFIFLFKQYSFHNPFVMVSTWGHLTSMLQSKQKENQ